jgi:hypothetical protein
MVDAVVASVKAVATAKLAVLSTESVHATAEAPR